jgi:osmotically-inducible protein OsmY
MRKILYVLPIMLAMGFLMIACDSDRPYETTASGTKKAPMSDSQLKDKIKARLDSDADVKAADLSVSADADHNGATLSGTVASEAVRTRAVALAKGASEGLVLTDKIDVKPPEETFAQYTKERAREERERATRGGDKVGDTLEDAWLHAKIVAKLITNSATPERKINVDVDKNVVTLRGTVKTPQEKSEAENVAKTTDGVKRVVNLLKVETTKAGAKAT